MALPLKKRKIVHASASTNAVEIARLKKAVYTRNLGEIKVLTASLGSTQVVNGGFLEQILTGIATGANQGQRIGNEIRIRSIELSGDTNNSTVDVYLLQSRTGVAPVVANFTPTISPHLTQGTSQEHFRILKHYDSSQNGNNKFYIKYNFSIPMKVSYTGPTNTELSTNQIYVVFINRSGGNQNVQFSSTIKYID